MESCGAEPNCSITAPVVVSMALRSSPAAPSEKPLVVCEGSVASGVFGPLGALTTVAKLETSEVVALTTGALTDTVVLACLVLTDISALVALVPTVSEDTSSSCAMARASPCTAAAAEPVTGSEVDDATTDWSLFPGAGL